MIQIIYMLIAFLMMRKEWVKRQPWLRIERTKILSKNYFDLSWSIPLEELVNVTKSSSSWDDQVDEEKNSSKSISRNDQQSEKALEGSINLNPEIPIDLHWGKTYVGRSWERAYMSEMFANMFITM